MKKRIMPILLAVLLLISLGGCKPRAPSEKRVKQDLIDNSVFTGFFSESAPEIDFFYIDDRQTRPENYTDTIWVYIKASNGAKYGSLSFIMTYTLYNDGWVLEEVKPDYNSENQNREWEFISLQDPPDEMINGCVPNNAFDVTSKPDSFHKDQFVVKFSTKDNLGYCFITETSEQILAFNSETGFWAPTEYHTIAKKYDFSPVIGTTWEYLKPTAHTDRNSGETINVGARLELDNIDSETLKATGKLTVYREYCPYGPSATAWYFQDGCNINFSDYAFNFEGDSLVMEAKSETKYKGIEFANEGNGNFIVMALDLEGGHREYTLEKIE